MKLPESLHPLFWNCDPNKINVKRSRKMIILEVLARGSLTQIETLYALYDKKQIAHIFREDVKGLRTLPAPVVYLFSGLFLNTADFEDYKAWHRNPLHRWEQRRIVS